MMTRTLIASLSALGLGFAATADTIHIAFDVSGGSSFSTVDTLTDGQIVSTGSNGNDTWNLAFFAASPTTSGSLANLALSDGTATTASIAATYNNAVNLGGSFDVLGQAGANDDYALFDGVLVMNSTRSITVSGLTGDFLANGYNVTIYTSHADTRTTTFTIGAKTTTTQQPSAPVFDGDPAGFFGTITDVTGSSFVLTGSSSNANTVYNLAGITITAVPEPGSLALMGLGGLFIVRRRRA